MTNPALREQAAIRAAQVVANRNLLEWLQGADLGSVTLIDQGSLTTDTIRQTITGTVPPAHLIAQHYDSETGTATVTLEFIIDKASLP